MKEEGSTDLWDKASAIRKGEIDDEMPTYDELTGWIGRIPTTWLPGLLRRTVLVCEVRHVFKEGGMESLVAQQKKVAKEPNFGALRDKTTSDEQ